MTKPDITIRFKNLKNKFNPAFWQLKDYFEKRLIIMYGGAGSGKSVASAQIIVLSLLQERNQLIVRKIARTHRHSVFAEVVKAMNDLKMDKFFKVREHDLFISCVNGAQAHFVGCDNVEKLKSITPKYGLFDDIHIEEATEISLQDFYVIDTRQRGQSRTSRRIFLRFNPIYAHHWIKKEFFDSDKWDCLKHHTTYKDNLFLSDLDKEKYEGYKDIDEYMYLVYALGQWGLLGGVIFDKYEVVDRMPEGLQGVKPLFGLDFGYENPSACVKVYCNDKSLYIADEVYERKLSNKQLAEEIRDLVEGNYVICDNEEPKSIQELKEYGIKSLAAKKGKGSVLTGIKFMKARNIYINERCVKTIEEFEQYRRKPAPDGTFLETPVDANNHSIDAIRYALEPLSNRSKVRTAEIP